MSRVLCAPCPPQLFFSRCFKPNDKWLSTDRASAQSRFWICCCCCLDFCLLDFSQMDLSLFLSGLCHVCWPVFNFMSAFSFTSWTKNVTHCSHLFCLFNIFFWFGMFSRQTLLVVPCILASYIITCDALLNNCMIIHHEWPHEALQMRPS